MSDQAAQRPDRRAEVAERLRGAVERLLREGETYASLSIERLMNEAGLSRSTFYAYFTDKGDLLRQWSTHASDATRAAAAAWVALGPDVSREQLRAALRRLIGDYQPHARVTAAIYDATVYDAALATETRAVMDAHRRHLADHVRRGQDEGWIDPALLPDETAAWICWMTERVLHQLVPDADAPTVDELADGLTGILWNVLYAPAGRTPAAA